MTQQSRSDTMTQERARQISDAIYRRYSYRVEPREVRIIAGRGLWSSGSLDVDREIRALADPNGKDQR